jgi:hypothetical protein
MMPVQDVNSGWLPIVGDKFPDVVRLLMWAMFVCGWAGEFLSGCRTPSSGDDLCGDHDELAGCLSKAGQVHLAIRERIPMWSFVVHGFGFVGCGDTIQEADQAYIAAAGKRHRGRKGTEFTNPVQVWTHPVHGWRIEGWDGVLGHVYQVRVSTGERCGLCDIVDGVLDTISGDQAPSGDLIDATSSAGTFPGSVDIGGKPAGDVPEPSSGAARVARALQDAEQFKETRYRQIDTYSAWMDEAGHRDG